MSNKMNQIDEESKLFPKTEHNFLKHLNEVWIKKEGDHQILEFKI